MADTTTRTAEGRRRARRRQAAFAVLMMAVGAGALMAAHEAMMLTSTPAFCASCHEIQPAYQSWRTSSHRVNDKGVVVRCVDCHLPDPNRFAAFYWAKTYHGVKDIVAHVLGRPYDRAAAQRRARASIPNQRCMRCHADLLATGMSRGAMLAHRAVLYPKRPGYEKSCLQCHENLVHRPRARFVAARVARNWER